ncbi:D-alanyl-D-alanine carboxypeptidase [Salinarimonas sp.]|uniref:D-alanyl-D-alanine carboxypeptidase n=1 Tax=Salinarimonas sp. TaxID=2766526 RepID=UPI00391B5498
MISQYSVRARKLLAVLPVLAAFVLASPTPAAAYDPPFAAIVVDVNAGRVLHEVNADHLRYPASITKVMTLYLVFERLEAGSLSLDTPLRVSARAAAEPPSKIGVKPGTTITVEQAIKALVTRSANDVATVVAENLGGSVEGFSALMTRRARAIGMERTEFRNAHGLPNAAQVSTARDLAVLAVAIQDRFPQYYTYFQTRSFDFEGTRHGNHNRLLGRVRGVDGIKTGFIRASGFNLMTNAKVDDRHIVTIVLGGRSGAHRDGIVTGLVERYMPQAYAGARTTRLVGTAPSAGRMLVAANVPTPPTRPLDLPVLVIAELDPEPDPEETGPAGERAVAAFGDLDADQGSTTLAEEKPETEVASAPAMPAMPAASASATATLRTAAAPVAAAPAASLQAAGEDAREDLAAGVAAQPDVVAELPEPLDHPVPPARPLRLAAAAQAAATAPAAAAAPAPSGHAIQLSAATSERAALDLLERARGKVGSPLAQAQPVAERVRNGSRTFYRARFAGFGSAGEAQSACRAVKRAGFDCFEMRL